jgi:hypothetical protein
LQCHAWQAVHRRFRFGFLFLRMSISCCVMGELFITHLRNAIKDRKSGNIGAGWDPAFLAGTRVTGGKSSLHCLHFLSGLSPCIPGSQNRSGDHVGEVWGHRRCPDLLISPIAESSPVLPPVFSVARTCQRLPGIEDYWFRSCHNMVCLSVPLHRNLWPSNVSLATWSARQTSCLLLLCTR